jgi:arginine-tRNA-protein transferase
MESIFRYVAPPGQCGYLPDQVWQLEYEHVADVTAAEYQQRMKEGWRRFGYVLFRPRCRFCTACESMRVVVDRFRPDRSQRRAWKANEGVIRVQVGEPRVDRARLSLYDRYHAYQTEAKGWPAHPAKDRYEYASSFIDNPFPTQEWCYYLGTRLVGVGYVDDLPEGLSAIYFFYDPDERHRSLGTFNVLSILRFAAERGLPHVYLGYYVAGSRSMVYKGRFLPSEVLGPDGVWREFRGVDASGGCP